MSPAVVLPAFYLLPNSPLQIRWLTPERRELATNRIALYTTNRQEEGATTWAGLRQGLAYAFS